MNSAKNRPLSKFHWLIPGLGLLAVTVAAWVTDLDLGVSSLFYESGGISGWQAGEAPLWVFLYNWGELPAVLLGIFACLSIAYGAFRSSRARLSRSGILILLALVIGPLLITNGLLKANYGRARPNQVVEFGGEREFRPVLVPSFRSDENSFPSGHAAAGFALLIPYFALRRRHPRWALAVLASGLAWGSLMGFTRIVQGGHFATDVVWAGGVIYFSGFAVTRSIDSLQHFRNFIALKHWTPARRYLVQGVALTFAILIGAAYLVRLPFSRTHEWVVPIISGSRTANIEIVTKNGKVRILRDQTIGHLRISTTAYGRGLPITPVIEKRSLVQTGASGPVLYYELLPAWSTIDFSSRIMIRVPKDVQVSIKQPEGDPEALIITESAPGAARRK